MRSINATAFKARCLAILDEVERTGEPVAVSKRGRIVAHLLPPRPASAGSFPQHSLRGSGRSKGDIIGPVLSADAWEAERQP
jgi:prevent-host-death family protein